MFDDPTENLWDVLEKALCSGPTLPSLIKDLGEKWMQLLKEINVMTLRKLLKMMPQQMCAVIKAKSSPAKYVKCIFFGPGSVILCASFPPAQATSGNN